MTGKEIIKKCIEFDNPERIGLNLADDRGIWGANDFIAGIVKRPEGTKIDKTHRVDEWGVVWETLDETGSNFGQPKKHPLADIQDFDAYKFPDWSNREDYKDVERVVNDTNKYVMQGLPCNIFERAHELVGYEHYMEYLYTDRDKVEILTDQLMKVMLDAIEIYGDIGVDGVITWEDWGVQDRSVINPKLWREMFKPRYAKFIEAIHSKGMHFILHSCGYLKELMGDLVEVGVDVLQLDQPTVNGIDWLSKNYGGKVCFFSPVDIQTTLQTGTLEEIEREAKYMIEALGRFRGGFIGKCYPEARSINLRPEAVKAMAEAFTKYGVY